jgi:lysyl-tRNA synthetase class 1
MSKSRGNLVTPIEWLQYASPESLRLLMYKRIVGARNISVEDVPVYMDEFDDLEEYYFSKRRDPNQMKDARLRGLYEYTMLLRSPKSKGVHVPYRLLAQLSSVAPEGSLQDFVTKRLVSYGMVAGTTEDLARRIDWASKWAGRGGKRAVELPEMGEAARRAIQDFAKALLQAKDADDIQNTAFAAAKRNGVKPGEFFPAVYSILLGSDRGPRLGPYVVDAGRAEVSKSLLEAVSS